MKRIITISCLFIFSILTMSNFKVEATQNVETSKSVFDNISLVDSNLKLISSVTNPNGKVNTQMYVDEDNNISYFKLDASEAQFFDESGKNVTDKVKPFVDNTYGLSGGKWNSGSGWSTCTGMTVSRTQFNQYSISFKVNFEQRSNKTGKINRVYGTQGSSFGGSFSWQTYTKIFRSNSDSLSRAYAGHHIMYNPNNGGSKLIKNYIQIKGNQYSQSFS